MAVRAEKTYLTLASKVTRLSPTSMSSKDWQKINESERDEPDSFFGSQQNRKKTVNKDKELPDI